MFFLTYVLTYFLLFLYSFTQIDLGLVMSRYPFFYQFEKAFQYIGYFDRPLSTIFYLVLVIVLTALYGVSLRLAHKQSLNKKFVWKIIIAGIILLVFSYNAFSYDIFNYIFDAKIVTHYHANPYVHKALDYPGDPMLAFMHWTHRVYPYGPFWLALTVPLSFFGSQIFLLTFFFFKFLMAASYAGSLYFIGKIFRKIKPEQEIFGLVFFGLNPLILIECLVSAHIDIVMMFFSLMSVYFLIERKYMSTYASFFFSAGIKFLTGILLPVVMWVHFSQIKKKHSNWDQVFGLSLVLLIAGVFLETRQSGNFQPWYWLAPLSYAVFLSRNYFILIPSVIISVFSLLLYVPYLYLGNWNPPVPQILSEIMLSSYLLSFIVVCIFFFLKREKS